MACELIAEEEEREVFDAEIMSWHEKEGQFAAPPPMEDPPMGESSDEGCVGEAASAVDPEFLSKVSYSRQSSKPPFLWNPYLWYLGLRSGVSPREKQQREPEVLSHKPNVAGCDLDVSVPEHDHAKHEEHAGSLARRKDGRHGQREGTSSGRERSRE